MPRVLILTDGKAGHENQSKAFARALGCEFDLVGVRFRSRFAKALSYPADRLGLGLERLFAVEAPVGGGYVAVLGTGSGTFYAVKTLARRLGARCGVVLYPRGYRLATFDCILAPSFDRPAKRQNVVEIPANLVANDESFYSQGIAAFCERSGEPVGSPAVAVIVGGPNKCSTMTPEWMRSELSRVFAENGHPRFAQASATSRAVPRFWVTTSRRTPPEVEAVVDSFPFDYRLLYSRDHFNPIPAFVGLASRLYVTAESTGMLSEACTFGRAEVRALDNLRPGPHKFRTFVDDLRREGYVDGTRKVDLAAPFSRAKALLGV